MYLEFFGLKEEPFNLTPDSHFLYFSEQHRKALVLVKYGIEQKKGFIALTGEVGSGKTTVCRALMKMLDKQKFETALILNSFISSHSLLKMICEDLEIPSGGEKETLIDRLNRFLLDQRERDKTVVLIIDECQNLSFEVLEQIRMLSNIETEKEKLLQIVLIGQPEFLEKLSSYELRQLNQRITVRAHLSPLSHAECRDYILHRLKVAGSDGAISFTGGAVKAIYRFCGGIPRKINIICDYALIVAYVQEKRNITESVVKSALKEIHIKRGVGLKQRLEENVNLRKKLASAAVFSVFLFFIAAMIWMYRVPALDFWNRKYGQIVSSLAGRKDISLKNRLPAAEKAKEMRPEKNMQETAQGGMKEEKPMEKGSAVESALPEESKPFAAQEASVAVPAEPAAVVAALPSASEPQGSIDIQVKGNISIEDIPEGVMSADLPSKENKVAEAAGKTPTAPFSQTPKKKDVISALPSGQKALWLLLSAWGIDYKFSEKEAEQGSDMKAVVDRLNYAGVEIWEGLDYLLALNMPFAAEMKTGDYWLVVRDEGANLLIKKDALSEEPVDKREFALQWKGKSMVLVEKRPAALSLDKTYCRGDKDKDIIKLKSMLQELGHDLAAGNDFFDVECENAVKEFQKGFLFTRMGLSALKRA